MAEVADAYVTLLPSARGFGQKLSRQLGGDLDAVGRDGGRRISGGMTSALGGLGTKIFAPLAAAVGVVGIGSLVKDSVQLEATFSQTMATIAAVAGVPKAQIKDLSNLAIKFGADTVFSASEASEAMLDLAKGGMTAADIKAGGLAATLKLAAAGGTDLGTAATIATNAMSAFGLPATRANEVANALAGGANASTASVESLGEALQQVGPGAKASGLSLQETVAALAAFDAAGIKGSDAGTSLKTMLANLVPDTKKSANAMHDLGLNFVDASGNFKPLVTIAGDLKKALDPLSESARTTALNNIFGSDASRAAQVLGSVGAEGLTKYIKATSSLTTAQEQADARMSGTAGALERLGGSWETLKLQLGQALAPAVTKGAELLSAGLGKVGPAASSAIAGLTPLGKKLTTALTGGGGKSPLQPLLDGVRSFGDSVAPALGPALTAMQGLGQRVLPVLVDFGTKLIGILGPAIASIGRIVGSQLLPAFTSFITAVTPLAVFLLKVFGGAILGAISGVVKVVLGALKILAGIFNVIGGILSGDWSRVWAGIKQIAAGAFGVLIGGVEVFLNIGILKAFRAGFNVLRAVVTGGWGLIRGTFTGAIGTLRNLVTGALRAIVSIFTSGVRSYVAVWTGGLRFLLTGARAALSDVVQAFTGLRGNVIGALKGAGSWLVGIGKNVVRGLTSGISSLKGDVTDALLGLIPGPLKKFAGALGINSPSKLFAKYGRWTGQGYAVGLTDSIPGITGAAKDMAASVVGITDSVPDGLGWTTSALASLPMQRTSSLTPAQQAATAGVTFEFSGPIVAHDDQAVIRAAEQRAREVSAVHDLAGVI